MRLTIFTPTYNRVNELPGLHNSIIKSISTMNDEQYIEWLIVDDGSVYDVESCVSSMEENAQLKIKLIRKENGGKHTAFNIAIELADSDIFVCIDDDDRLTENALADIFSLAEKYRGKDYGGFVGRVIDEDGKLLGDTVFNDSLVSNTIEIRDRYHFWGEPEVFFTSILKKYRFDVFPGERFLTEAYVFDQMSLNYPFVYTNIPLMVKVYLPNGLTDNQLKIRMQCPLGCEAYYYQRKLLSSGFKYKLKATINRRRFSRYSKKSPKRPFDGYELVAMPIAWLMSMKDRKKCPNLDR